MLTWISRFRFAFATFNTASTFKTSQNGRGGRGGEPVVARHLQPDVGGGVIDGLSGGLPFEPMCMGSPHPPPTPPPSFSSHPPVFWTRHFTLPPETHHSAAAHTESR